jgi:hypothetical protein
MEVIGIGESTERGFGCYRDRWLQHHGQPGRAGIVAQSIVAIQMALSPLYKYLDVKGANTLQGSCRLASSIESDTIEQDVHRLPPICVHESILAFSVCPSLLSCECELI